MCCIVALVRSARLTCDKLLDVSLDVKSPVSRCHLHVVPAAARRVTFWCVVEWMIVVDSNSQSDSAAAINANAVMSD